MARYTGPVCRLCRRERVKLYLKGVKCDTPKCPLEKRPFPPGQHGRNRGRETQYLLQLREKQKARRYYGVLERQFRRVYEEAARTRGITGETLLKLLETRLDNVVYRAGLALSRPQARQLVRHRHFEVDGRVVDIPSYRVRPGQVVRVREGYRDLFPFIQAVKLTERRGVPSWLDVDKEAMTVRVISEPRREEIDAPVQEGLIVELYSK